jgi:hypothetical protein
LFPNLGAIVVGRWPFPPDVSIEQLPSRRQLPPSHTRLILCVLFEDSSLRGRCGCSDMPISFLAPLLGFVKDRPSSVIAVSVHSQLPEVQVCQNSNTFRPCRFSRLRRFTPLSVARACCIPLPDMGFARFSADCQPRLTSNGPHERTTLQSFPFLISRLRRRRRPFLLAVTSPPESGLPRPQGFVPMKNPL